MFKCFAHSVIACESRSGNFAKLMSSNIIKINFCHRSSTACESSRGFYIRIA